MCIFVFVRSSSHKSTRKIERRNSWVCGEILNRCQEAMGKRAMELTTCSVGWLVGLGRQRQGRKQTEKIQPDKHHKHLKRIVHLEQKKSHSCTICNRVLTMRPLMKTNDHKLPETKKKGVYIIYIWGN